MDQTHDPNPALTLTPEAMRELGRRAVDVVVNHFDTLRDEPVSRVASREAMEKALREDPPARPRRIEDVLQRVRDEVLDNMVHVDHPRNFGFVPGPSNYVGVIADFLTSGYNVFAGTWLEGSGAAMVELVTIDWLRRMVGLPDTTEGLFVSGGSAANLTGLFVAREEKLPDGPAGGVVYLSAETHASVGLALRMLGFRQNQVRRIETDGDLGMDLTKLERAVASDRREGRAPFCVVANAGTTNSGAVDPLPALAAFCQREELWLHADGAYGAVAALAPRGREALTGLELVDSLSLDPHKWLFQPYEIGCALVRRGNLLRHFETSPAYLEDVRPGSEEVNFCDRGLQLTRSFRALKLWMTIQVFGMDAIRAAVERGIEMAEIAEAELSRHEEIEVMTSARLGVVSFRYRASGEQDDSFQRRIVRAVIDDGFCLVSSTVLFGKTAMRMCTINPRTTVKDMKNTVERIVTIGRELSKD
jgi:glutamate/tyrosine decarboxylase-like PLP-dependent enzyme